jgi:hypothetical protein
MRAVWRSPVLAQRAASEGPRWMRAVRRPPDRPLEGIENGIAVLGERAQEFSCQSLGAAVGTSSVRMVFIHSLVMVLRSSMDMPA